MSWNPSIVVPRVQIGQHVRVDSNVPSSWIAVDDPNDVRLADYVRLRETSLRRHLESEHGLFIAEGEKVIRRAVESGFRPRSFLLAERWLAGLTDVLRRWPDVPVYVVSEELAEEVTGFHVHRGALASLHREIRPTVGELLANREQVGAPSRSRVAVLEDLVDHANVGAAFRNAAALGVDFVLLSPRCADPLYRRAVKVSMGAVLQIPWARVKNWPVGLAELRHHGYVIAGMTLAEDSITLDELVARDHPMLALAFGTEGHGLTARTAAVVDVRVRIPMAGGIDSLNVAASSAVAFYATR